ncbi:hypothetical protein HMPREF0658_2192 [Hoylesella marshii DSM 16973 = JCM 13450]|uniref:Uncharacterized protein n=1 Tax=Hoylesella marshii DSM 16973 = JCM 13450 TaxID=862515 RepID=E0NVI7_9BACT|nr:hypothetical protein HMPREF0658_2192 [Hoylesella marshii DSM 16973 = JCM 13450]
MFLLPPSGNEPCKNTKIISFPTHEITPEAFHPLNARAQSGQNVKTAIIHGGWQKITQKLPSSTEDGRK